MPESRLCL